MWNHKGGASCPLPRKGTTMEKVTVSRLIEWLAEHGHDSDDIVDCIAYITAEKPVKEESKKETEE